VQAGTAGAGAAAGDAVEEPGTEAPVETVHLEATGPFVEHVEDRPAFEDRPAMSRDEYELLIGELPMPRQKQIREFAAAVAAWCDWHQCLSLLPPGAAFRFYLDPRAGMDRVVLTNGVTAFLPREEGAAHAHAAWISTREYQRRFGFLAFACAEAPRLLRPIRIEAGGETYEGMLDNNVTYAVLWVPQEPFHVPEPILKAGTCMVTGVVHPGAAHPAAWQATLERVKLNHAWPIEGGGPKVLGRIRERVAAAGTADQPDAELDALLAPERERLMGEMVAAMNRMIGQLHGSL
jgi:hypothetical protein